MSAAQAIAAQSSLIATLREHQATHRYNSDRAHDPIKAAEGGVSRAQEAVRLAREKMATAADVAAAEWMQAKEDLATAQEVLVAAKAHGPAHHQAEAITVAEYQAHIDAANAVIVKLGGTAV